MNHRLDHGLPVNLQLADTGESLLMAASSSGNYRLVEMLLRKGAKADLEDRLRHEQEDGFIIILGRIRIRIAARRCVCLFASSLQLQFAWEGLSASVQKLQ